MPVLINEERRWPDSRIPYVVIDDDKTAHEAIQEINKCVGYHILVDRRPGDLAYLELENAYGKAESIGRIGEKKHYVRGTSIEMFMHETLHVLGAIHEQYHRGYPWLDSDPVRKLAKSYDHRSGFSFSYKKRTKTPWNNAMFKYLAGTYGNEFSADNQLDVRHSAVSDQRLNHFRTCDLDSVMMYPDSKTAYEKAFAAVKFPLTEFPAQPRASGKYPGYSDFLSNVDVEGIRHMYPNPGKRCVKCAAQHGYLPSVVNQWHRCTACEALYCPTCAGDLHGKLAILNPYRRCDRYGCNGRTAFA